MTQQPEKKEHPSTYIVQDRENQAELTRLTLQDHLLTVSFGGVLAEQSGAEKLQRVLDIGCGTGGWAIETAQTYPGIALVIGIDISQRMVAYARQQAESQQLAGRVEFHVMDALRMLEFPDRFFDLVNMRLGGSWLRTWDWTKLLSEITRVLRVGGIVRITEQEIVHENAYEASRQINQMVLCAFYRSGHLFTEASTGLTSQIPSLLTRSGFAQIQSLDHTLEYQAGTPEGDDYIRDMIAASRTLRPFLEKWGCLSDNYDELCQQLARAGESPDFSSTWHFHTIWATKA